MRKLRHCCRCTWLDWFESSLGKRGRNDGGSHSYKEREGEGLCTNPSAWMLKKEVQALYGILYWTINLIIADIENLILSFNHLKVSYIPRILNHAAHSLAKFCFSCNQDIIHERALMFLGGCC